MIDEWRRQIDEVDQKILRLLNLRAELVHRIGHKKRAQGLPLRSPSREEEVIRLVQERNPGPLSAEAMERIFRLIIAESLNLQEEVVKNDCGDEAGSDPRADRGS
jgi:chorismate mutase-like protein